MATELEIGQYYHDHISNDFLLYVEKDENYYWFILIDENRYVAYTEEELENLWRY